MVREIRHGKKEAFRFPSLGEQESRMKLREYAAALPLMDSFAGDHMVKSRGYGIEYEGESIGFLMLFEEELLTAFRVEEPFLPYAMSAMERAIESLAVREAFCLTCDELFLSLCLDFQRGFTPQAHNFAWSGKAEEGPAFPISWMRPAREEDLPFVESGELIENSREQMEAENLFLAVSPEGVRLGFGNLEPHPLREAFVDVGMYVAPEERRKGIGKAILQHLCTISMERGLTPVAGCWYYNYLSKMTLEKAGFLPKSQLIRFRFR